jgi:hypothetical protein
MSQRVVDLLSLILEPVVLLSDGPQLVLESVLTSGAP